MRARFGCPPRPQSLLTSIMAAEKELQVYDWAEISKHNHSESLWLVIDGKVYDVTNFMEEHPGGEEVMLEVAGKDSTESFEDVGHSPDARDQQAKYLIGVVSGPAKKKSNSELETSISEASGGGSSLVYLVPMLGILIVGMGIAYYLS